ncbi:PREDICTED: venom allergen 5-like [Rhagoletis zephyria]|uniref:venom allergen 5-like n=1 Tax=Rhagoletis zephyria TaxID=28612 RepID=UPI0008116AAD|nr:PREDICTED: venom allergen 5-like [Rhagoletis zephyria]
MSLSIYRDLLLLFLALRLAGTNAYYYCGEAIQKELCGRNPQHIICHPETVPIDGTLLALAPLTNKIKRLFVDRHNELRNKLAGGEQVFKGGGKFPIASRMREVLWDDELAYIAGQHASRCHMMHDKCRSTKRFPGAGQNLYIIAGRKKFSNMSQEALSSVEAWWSEAELVDDGNLMVEKFPEGAANWHDIGHFSAMANERAAFVGCGIALCEKCSGDNYCVEISCDYSETNIAGTFMYKKGDSPASECDFYESTPSAKYPNLCINTGKFFNGV